jgi:hypothetical protein
LRAFFENLPGDPIFPLGFAIERHAVGLDLLLRELTRQLLKFALLVGQADVEHRYLVSI